MLPSMSLQKHAEISSSSTTMCCASTQQELHQDWVDCTRLCTKAVCSSVKQGTHMLCCAFWGFVHDVYAYASTSQATGLLALQG